VNPKKQDLRAIGIRTLAEAEARTRAIQKKDSADEQQLPPPHLEELFPRAGIEHITPAETALCNQLQITPLHFLTVKNILLRECIRAGFVSQKKLAKLVVDANAGKSILDFLVSENLVGVLDEA